VSSVPSVRALPPASRPRTQPGSRFRQSDRSGVEKSPPRFRRCGYQLEHRPRSLDRAFPLAGTSVSRPRKKVVLLGRNSKSWAAADSAIFSMVGISMKPKCAITRKKRSFIAVISNLGLSSAQYGTLSVTNVRRIFRSWITRLCFRLFSKAIGVPTGELARTFEAKNEVSTRPSSPHKAIVRTMFLGISLR
jgi:hypothetical protein